MKKSRKTISLYFVTFGIIELGSACFFSGLIWIGSYVNDYILPTIINLTLLGITLIYSLWQFCKRSKARSYLLGLLMRILFIGSVIVLYQIGFAAFTPKSGNYLWLVASGFVYVIAVMYWFKKEESVWELTLEGLQKYGKINTNNGYFKIRKSFYTATGKPFNPNKKGTLVGYVVAIGFFIFKLLERYIEGDFIVVLLRFGFLFLSYVAGMAFGKFLLYTIEIRKLEKKLGIEFVTEFGEIGNPKISGGKKNRIKLSQNK